MSFDLREKDLAVLQAIQDGATTVSEIREATTLTNREVNYSLVEYSLEEMGLVEVQRRTGREWQEIEGHEQNIWKPKGVKITDEGILALQQSKRVERYAEMSKRELIEKVQELEERQDRLETVFKDFREKVMRRL